MRYHLITPLGRGGYGTVYRARESGSNRLFAVKVMSKSANPKDESMALAHRGEGCILPSLKHPHIIQQHFSHGWGTPRVEVVLSLMEGTLYDLNTSSTNYPTHRRPHLADEVLRQMLPALVYLGGLGYVHRDIKPDNIFYNTTTTGGHGHGGTHHFRLGDFGLCEFGSVIAAGGGDIIGTKSYLAPELHRHHPKYRCQTHKSDVWALYVTVLWALEGDALWDEVGCGGYDGKSLEFRYRLSAKAMREEELWGLRYMARSDPSERVTAKVMERVLAAGGIGVLC